MTLIKSISGIRGTIGGHTGDTLNPLDIVKFTTAYATFIGKTKKTNKIVVGRDARISGSMVNRVVAVPSWVWASMSLISVWPPHPLPNWQCA